MAPTIVTPTRPPRILEPSSTPELGCSQVPTLSYCLYYSILAYLVPFQACAYLCVPILCFLCFLCYPVSPFLYTLLCYVPFLASDIPTLMLFLFIPYIRLPLMYAFNMFEYRL